jgi:hypothetical protein
MVQPYITGLADTQVEVEDDEGGGDTGGDGGGGAA